MIRPATNEEIRKYVAYKKKYGIENRGVHTPNSDNFHYALLIENCWLQPWWGNIHFAHFDYEDIYSMYTTPSEGHKKTLPVRTLGPKSRDCLKEQVEIKL